MPTPDLKLIRADEVLDDRLDARRAFDLDTRYGNADFLGALEVLRVGGPFRVLSPWELENTRGERSINAGGYSALPFGDAYPPLMDFLRDYLERNRVPGLPQSAISPWRAALQSNLVALLAREAPSHADSKVFFSNSGAEAIEGALKFAKASRPKAKYFLNFSGAYHGKTFMALSLTPNRDYQDLFRPLMRGVRTLPYGDTEAFERAVRTLGPDQIVTVIVEPLQGESGVIAPPPGFLRRIGELCREHGIPVIADEIQTGLGRTGHWFESLAQGLEPDIITLAKPLGGGIVPVGATIARKAIYRKMLSGFESKRHSNTFGGGSLAMAVGLKSLDLLVEGDLPARSARLGEVGVARLRDLQARFPDVLTAVRGRGMLLAMQFQPVLNFGGEAVAEASSLLAMRELSRAGVQANASLSAKRILRLTPALNMPEELFHEMFDRVDTAISGIGKPWRIVSRTLRSTPPADLARLVRILLNVSKD